MIRPATLALLLAACGGRVDPIDPPACGAPDASPVDAEPPDAGPACRYECDPRRAASLFGSPGCLGYVTHELAECVVCCQSSSIPPSGTGG